MSFKVTNKKLLNKYNKIWEKVEVKCRFLKVK